MSAERCICCRLPGKPGRRLRARSPRPLNILGLGDRVAGEQPGPHRGGDLRRGAGSCQGERGVLGERGELCGEGLEVLRQGRGQDDEARTHGQSEADFQRPVADRVMRPIAGRDRFRLTCRMPGLSSLRDLSASGYQTTIERADLVKDIVKLEILDGAHFVAPTDRIVERRAV